MHRVFRMPKTLKIARVERMARGRGIGVLMRGSAVLAIGLTIMHGALRGGHLGDDGASWHKLSGQLSSVIGMAADDIRITGLNHQSPETVLSALGIRPGASLIGFDASQSRALLENLDWVASAKVQRLFPNQLEIEVAERQPFAVWQKGGSYYVIDRSGAAMSSLDPSKLPALPLITGEGAEKAAEGLVNQLEATPDIMLKLYAAARVGKRRWNLYFDHGVTVMLPDRDVDKALTVLMELEQSEHLLSKGIKSVDLRYPDRVIVGVADGTNMAAVIGTGPGRAN
jgi:cell division protein FtsQ